MKLIADITKVFFVTYYYEGNPFRVAIVAEIDGREEKFNLKDGLVLINDILDYKGVKPLTEVEMINPGLEMLEKRLREAGFSDVEQRDMDVS